MGKSFYQRGSLWLTNFGRHKSDKCYLCSHKTCDELLNTKGSYCDLHCLEHKECKHDDCQTISYLSKYCDAHYPKCKDDDCNENIAIVRKTEYDHCRHHMCDSEHEYFENRENHCNSPKQYPFKFCKDCICSDKECAEKKLTDQISFPEGKCKCHSKICKGKVYQMSLLIDCVAKITANKTYCSQHECSIDTCNEQATSNGLCATCIKKSKNK
jgi:hypothetical protein